MSKFFVPLEISDLHKQIGVYNQILCSLMCRCRYEYVSQRAFFGYGTPRAITKFKWRSHILISNRGIAYKDQYNTSRFHFWKGPRTFIKFKKHELIFNNGYKFVGLEQPGISLGVIHNNFVNFCKILYRRFQDWTSEMDGLARNNELMRKRITDIGYEKFCDEVETLFFAGYESNAFKIAKNALEDTPKEERKDLWYLWGKLQCGRGKNLFNQFSKNQKERNNTVIPTFQAALDSYNKALELDPMNPEIMEGKKFLQWNIEWSKVPVNIQEKINNLYSKGLKKFLNKKFEKALEIFKKCIETTPVPDDTYAEKYIDALYNLGRYAEIQSFLSEYTFLDAKILDKIKKKIQPTAQLQLQTNQQQKEKIKCSYCNKEILSNSNFCEFCGKQTKIKCPYCNNDTRSNSNFCEKCGKELI